MDLYKIKNYFKRMLRDIIKITYKETQKQINRRVLKVIVLIYSIGYLIILSITSIIPLTEGLIFLIIAIN